MSSAPYVCVFKMLDLIIVLFWNEANPDSLEVNGNFASDLNESEVRTYILASGFRTPQEPRSSTFWKLNISNCIELSDCKLLPHLQKSIKMNTDKEWNMLFILLPDWSFKATVINWKYTFFFFRFFFLEELHFSKTGDTVPVLQANIHKQNCKAQVLRGCLQQACAQPRSPPTQSKWVASSSYSYFRYFLKKSIF